jgi:hypothetical protein
VIYVRDNCDIANLGIQISIDSLFSKEWVTSILSGILP